MADVTSGDLLITLPTLTEMELVFVESIPHADFLAKLPLLRVLTLHCERPPWRLAPAPARHCCLARA